MLVITGGFDKGLDLTPLIDALDGARHVIVTGTTAQRTVEAIHGRWPVSRADSMHDAVKRADQLATEGDVGFYRPRLRPLTHIKARIAAMYLKMPSWLFLRGFSLRPCGRPPVLLERRPLQQHRFR